MMKIKDFKIKRILTAVENFRNHRFLTVVENEHFRDLHFRCFQALNFEKI